jgi:hypothetical protein
MAGTAPLAPYYSYMLRFWPETQPSGEKQWRFTLVDPNQDRRRAFSTLESLVEFLSEFIETESSPNHAADQRAASAPPPSTGD